MKISLESKDSFQTLYNHNVAMEMLQKMNHLVKNSNFNYAID